MDRMNAQMTLFSVSLTQGSYPLTGIHVSRLEDGDHHKNAFELAGILFSCSLSVFPAVVRHPRQFFDFTGSQRGPACVQSEGQRKGG